jgi:hypothetical protein
MSDEIATLKKDISDALNIISDLKADITAFETVHADDKLLIKRQTEALAEKYERERWRTVREELPIDFKPVLVFDGEEVFVAHLETRDFRRWYMPAWNNEIILNVTHWHPLPDPLCFYSEP